MKRGGRGGAGVLAGGPQRSAHTCECESQQPTRSEDLLRGGCLGKSPRLAEAAQPGGWGRGDHKDGRRAMQGRMWNPATPLPFQGKAFKELLQNSNKI